MLRLPRNPCPSSEVSDYGQVVSAVSPTAFWSLNSAAEEVVFPQLVVGNCRYARMGLFAEQGPGVAESPPRIGVRANGVPRESFYPREGTAALMFVDASLGGEASYSWWFAAPQDNPARTVLLHPEEDQGIDVVVEDGLTITLGLWPCSGSNLFSKRQQTATLGSSILDGKFHHVAVGYNQASLSSWIAIDGEVKSSQTGNESILIQDCPPPRTGNKTLRVPKGGAVDELAIFNRSLTPTEVATLGSIPCPGYVPRLDGQPTGQVCGNVVYPVALKHVDSGAYFRNVSGSLRSFVPGSIPKEQFDKPAVERFTVKANTRCLHRRTAVFGSFNERDCGLYTQRTVKVDRSAGTVTVVSPNVILRNPRKDDYPQQEENIRAGTLFYCMVPNEAGTEIISQECDQRGWWHRRAFEFEGGLDVLQNRKSEGDLVQNPGDPQVAATGLIFVKSGGEWLSKGTGTIVSTKTATEEEVLLLVTAFHVVQDQTEMMFVPGHYYADDPATLNGERRRDSYLPYGAFLFNDDDVFTVERVGGQWNRPNLDVAVAVLNKHVPISVKSWQSGWVTIASSPLARKSKASDFGMNIPFLRLARRLNETQLAKSLWAGYPGTLGGEMNVAALPAKLARDYNPDQEGTQKGDLYRIRSALGKGASGGPVFVKNEVVGVISFGSVSSRGLVDTFAVPTDAPELQQMVSLAQKRAISKGLPR
jgi:hypothetical protein